MSYATAMIMAQEQRKRRGNDDPRMGEETMRPIRWGNDQRREMGGSGWFAWDGGENEPMRRTEPAMPGGNVTDMRAYARQRDRMPGRQMHHGEHEHSTPKDRGRIGFGEREHDDDDRADMQHDMELTRDSARKWIESLQGPDGKELKPIGFAEVQRIAPTYGMTNVQDMLEFWVVINMVKSDYLDVGQKYAGDAVSFYADLAKAWIDDGDAVPDKLQAYKRYITKQHK